MNIILKKQLERRTFLRGMGTVLALPMLDAMMPALVRAASTASPTRMAILYFPNGVQETTWNIASGSSWIFNGPNADKLTTMSDGRRSSHAIRYSIHV